MKTVLLMFTLVSLASSVARAEEPTRMPTARKIVVAPDPHLWLEGNSTFHRYKADAKEFSAEIEVDPNAGDQSLDALVRTDAIKTLTVKVPVRKLKSGESGLDDNMYKSLKADTQAVIVFRMLSYKAVKPNGRGFDLVIHGRLEVAGVSHDIDVNAVVAPAGAALRLTGSVDVLMSDYQVHAPVIALVVKTDDKVTIKFDLALR